MSTVVDRERVFERLRSDTPYYAANCIKILDKKKRIVPLIPNAAQLALDGILEKQAAQGKPQRLICLKARQLGISTWIQAKLIQRTTLIANYEAVSLAHDRETGAKFHKMFDRMYRNLPPTPDIKPPIRYQQRARFFHFAAEDPDTGALFPDSVYLIDTAGEAEAGHGGTNSAVHASEVARWPNPLDKFTALKITVPREPGTLFVIESTANGGGLFKDLWDEAEGGSEYAPFFWPWWKHEEYTLPFVNEAERELFAEEVGSGPYGEDEPALLDPGPIDTLSGAQVPLTLEQLHWRRATIASECSTKLEVFRSQFPSTPEEAFIATGRKVFDPFQVAFLVTATERTDPRVATAEHPGPALGNLEAAEHKQMVGRSGPLQVAAKAKFTPREKLPVGTASEWKLWRPEVKPEEGYVIGVDVSEGISESEESSDPAYHAIQVIDHKSGLQVAEYVSRVDSELLAEQVLLAALYFNDAWVAVEKTGYGLPTNRKLWHDFHYPYVYRRKSHDQTSDTKVSDRLGWDTSRATKPILIAGGEQMLREGTTGIQSRRLALELQTYIRDNSGKMKPEPGKFADCLMAWLIARQIALEKPFKPKRKTSASRGIVGAYGAVPSSMGR